MSQKIISGKDINLKIKEVLNEYAGKKCMLVCRPSYDKLEIKKVFDVQNLQYVKFCNFTPNPKYEEVLEGVRLYKEEKCDFIIAIGGGSALDVAKCIKIFCNMDESVNYLDQELKETKIPLIAVPTTAGTGSESTRYAVIYYKGEKYSVTHESIVPEVAILVPSVLEKLPQYQRKCTVFDALCQAIESYWSVNSTPESKTYSELAIRTIVENIDEYIYGNSFEVYEKILVASNYAGRAINITQTTSAHAMSYKLTSNYNLPHGHAVAICIGKIWEYMIANTDKCLDARGKEYLEDTFGNIAKLLGCDSCEQAIEYIEKLLVKFGMESPDTADRQKELCILAKSVNPGRLKNNPVLLDEETLYGLYERIVK